MPKQKELLEALSRKLKGLRETRGLSVASLAERAGIGVSTLYKIEQGRVAPTVYNLYRLARALGVPVGELLGGEDGDPVQYTPRGKGVKLRIQRKGLKALRITTLRREQKLYGLLLTLAPRSRTARAPLTHPGEELLYGLEGKIVVAVEGKEYLLREGDALHYPATLPHLLANPFPKEARILYLLTPTPLEFQGV